MTKKTEIQEAGGSLNDHIERIRISWSKQFRSSEAEPYTYVVDVFPDYVVACQGGYPEPNKKYYEVAYAVSDDVVPALAHKT